MKRLWIAAVAAGWTWAAQAGMGIVWSTCGWIVEAGGDTDAGPGVAENNVITWQLLYAGANNVPDAINPSATGWTGGDDILLAERVVPAGGGTAADGTSWDSLLMQQGGDTTYEDLTWPADRGGFVFQRVFQGTPSDGTPYAESGLFAFNPAFAGNGALPDHFYFPADGYGLVLDRAVTTTPPVPYWDPVNHTTNTCETYTPYTGQTTLAGGWWVVSGDITNNTRIAVDGDVHLILCDGASLTANAGVNVASNECFTIWAQSDGPDMGRLTAQGSLSAAGIGGGSGETAGRVAINGGTVNATGRFGGAGIGGGSCGTGGTVTVNGGAVTATGIGGGAGIGGGTYGAGGMVTVNGGAITAIAGEITFIEVSSGIDIDVEVEISGPKAIGNGVFLFDATITIPIDEGGLVFPGTYCAYSPETATEPVDATKRMDACRGDRVKLTRCDPHGAAYRNNGADHTAHCPYCGAEGATEPHAFVNGVCACGALEPGVTDVRAESGAPGSGTVTISFNVTNSPAAVCPGWNAPFLSIVATDNLTGSNYVSDVSALSARAPYQLAAALAGSNGTHEVTWNMGAQGIDFFSSNVTFTVAYLRMPDYCVIDLSGEPGTGNQEPGTESGYAVSYLDAEPEGGWTDLYKTTNLVMRLLAPGTFTMGVDGSYHGNQSHSVTLTQPFYCAVFETTQKQWELVKGDRPSHYTNETYYATRPVEIVKWNMIRGDAGTYNWPNVKDVDPESFLGVLRLKTGLTSLDLPTEAQWEYACRAGTVTHFNNGKNLTGDNYDTNLNEVARYSYNGGLPNPSSFHGAARDCATNFATAVVGSYKPNLWGLYDMHGNVCEWCLDWWDGNLDGTSVTNPPGSSSGSRRVIRGGGLSSDPSGCTSSRRGGYNPPSAGINIGFRLVRTLSDNPESERSAEAAAGAKRAGTVCAGTSAPVAVGMKHFADTDIRLTAYSGVYDGQPHTIDVTTNAIEGLVLKYCAGDSLTTYHLPLTTVKPQFTDVANVTVFVEASAPGYYPATNSATVTITKAANAWIKAPSMAGWTVGAASASPNKGKAKFGTATVAYGKAGGAAGGLGATRPSAAGSYVATFTVSGTANYGGLVKNVSFTIKAKPAPKPMPTPKPKTYTVKFSANGGKLPKGKKMVAQTFTPGKAKKLRGNAFTRDGYVFIGWSTRKNGPIAYKNGRKVKNLAKAGKTVTLYAVWAKAEYKVVFDASGGRGKMPVQAFKYGTAQKLYSNKFTRKGYVFGGWAIRDPLATIPKIAYKNGQAVKNLSHNGGTVKLYAVWKRR